MDIRPGDLADPRIQALLISHLRQCRAVTPQGSAHALDLSGLQSRDIDLFAAWDGEDLVGVGALKRLDGHHGEIKSMHTAQDRRGGGIGRAMLARIESEARRYGLDRLFLETGSFDFFFPARRLYRKHGFRDCPPFEPYVPDPNSAFMTRALSAADPRSSTEVVEVRAAQERDLPETPAITNEIIANSTAIYLDIPLTLEARRAWYSERTRAGLPVYVAERARQILGFCSYGPWREPRAAYRGTVEHSVHVRADVRGFGIGAALMQALLDHARTAGVHTMLGAVDAADRGSIRFHEKLGFVEVGLFSEVGLKFGRRLDLAFMQTTFRSGSYAPARTA